MQLDIGKWVHKAGALNIVHNQHHWNKPEKKIEISATRSDKDIGRPDEQSYL